jgi:hypothetical protein
MKQTLFTHPCLVPMVSQLYFGERDSFWFVANSSHLEGIFLWVFNVEENARKEFHKLSKKKEKKRKEKKGKEKRGLLHLAERLDLHCCN